jgi:hypothetical protein
MIRFSYDFFLRENSTDEPLVYPLAELRQTGLLFCFDKWIIKPSAVIMESI